MSKLKTRERPARRGESGRQVEHVDEETGIVVCTHAAGDGIDRKGAIESAHESLRHDVETRDGAGREYAKKLGDADARRHAEDHKRGDS